MDFIDKHHIKFNHQYDFEKDKSTEHAIIELYFNFVTANEKQEKKFVCLDGFDHISHIDNKQ